MDNRQRGIAIMCAWFGVAIIASSWFVIPLAGKLIRSIAQEEKSRTEFAVDCRDRHGKVISVKGDVHGFLCISNNGRILNGL